MSEDTAASAEKLAALFYRAFKFMARAHHHYGHAEHAQMHVLALLRDRTSLNQRDLMEMLNVRSASLSEILGKLEHRGFIERARDEQDKRNFVITVTRQGAAAVAANEDVRRKSAEAFFASLSENERQRLAELLEKVIHALEKDMPGHACRPDHGVGHPRGQQHDHEGHGGRHGHHARGGEGSGHGRRASPEKDEPHDEE
ncbi:MAG: MarR family transcriptional regulator [Desulfovibrio sp.]|jgi:DNA-binding MarR family transcriptional regulator|nr:MarR family transcriptional regulator [Desulfovibrio sp.]